jgi:hypothetical protein
MPYECQFGSVEHGQFVRTKAVLQTDHTVKCPLPTLLHSHQGKCLTSIEIVTSTCLFFSRVVAVEMIDLSIYDAYARTNVGHYDLPLIDCLRIQSCTKCSVYVDHCRWNMLTQSCIARSLAKSLTNDSIQCPSIYLTPAIQYLSEQTNATLTVQIRKCNASWQIQSCQLHHHRRRILLRSSEAILQREPDDATLCSVHCSFDQLGHGQTKPITDAAASLLDLSVHFMHRKRLSIPQTHIVFYRCSSLASNCSACMQLDPAYGCTWCQNTCTLKSQVDRCLNTEQCMMPTITRVEPTLLPIHGGSLVTLHGAYFELANISITLANIPCRLIVNQSAADK